jgi:spore coat protein U-like protein
MKSLNCVKSAVVAAALGFLALGLASTPSFAATQTTTFAVTASVQGTCTVSAGALSFGAYSGTLINAQSNVSVNCTGGTTYNVGLSAGGGGSVTTRKMTGQYLAGTLGYALYSNAGHTANWGVTIGTDTLAGAGTGVIQSLPVYGQIPAGTAPAVDGYSDTITATVTY